MNGQISVTGTGVLRTKSSVNIRSGPSLNDSVIRQGKNGDSVQVLGQSKPSGDRFTWYRIKFGSGQNDLGWVREDLIEVSLNNPNPPDVSTRLFFVTDSKTVRIYEDDGQVYMNVYDNRSEVTDPNGAPVAKIPQLDRDDRSISYVALQGRSAYYIRFIPFGEVDFILSDRNNANIRLQEKGFRASGTEYQRS